MRKLYIATALISFVLALITQLPAKLAWQWAAQTAAENQLYMTGINGVLIDGAATQMTISSIPIRDTRWQVNSWRLLTAVLQLDISGSLDKYPVTGRLNAYPTGTLTLTDLDAAISLSRLVPLLQLPIMPLKGILTLNMEQLAGSNGKPVYAEGRAEIRRAQWMLMKPAPALGTLAADITTEENVIKADLSSEGPLAIKGTCSLTPEGAYSADIQLKANPGADPRINNMLKTLGQPESGWYRLKTQGQLPD